MSKAQDAADTARAIKENAANLGLTWNMRLATVFTAGVAATVRFDGDDPSVPPVPAISLIGAVALNSRVMTLAIPPHTLFIVGKPDGVVTRQLTNDVVVTATSDLTLTTTPTQVPGLIVTVSPTGAARWVCTWFADMRETGAGTTVGAAQLLVDGVTQTPTAFFEMITTTDRTTVGQQAAGTFTAGGNHSFSIFGSKTVALGTNLIDSSHSTLRVEIYE